MNTLLVGFVLGIPASVIAAYLYDMLREKMIYRKLDIEGTWGEFVKNSEGRQFSLGQIYRDKRRRIYAFDGTNYNNDGTPYCHWTTINSHIDKSQGQFFYTFRAQVEDEPDRQYYGFGVVNLAPDISGKLVPVSGHYVSANVDGKGMAHSMVKSGHLKYHRSVSAQAAISFIRSATPSLISRRGRSQSP